MNMRLAQHCYCTARTKQENQGKTQGQPEHPEKICCVQGDTLSPKDGGGVREWVGAWRLAQPSYH